jgi:hypothetical protein
MKLPVLRALFVLGIGLGLLAKLAQAASAAEIAVNRGADRQARLEKAAKAEGEFVCIPRLTRKTSSASSSFSRSATRSSKPNPSGSLQRESCSATRPNTRPAHS